MSWGRRFLIGWLFVFGTIGIATGSADHDWVIAASGMVIVFIGALVHRDGRTQ